MIGKSALSSEINSGKTTLTESSDISKSGLNTQSMRVKIQCPVCRGEGQVQDQKTQKLRTCVACGGSGNIMGEPQQKKTKEKYDRRGKEQRMADAVRAHQHLYLTTRKITDLQPMILLEIAQISRVNIATVSNWAQTAVIDDVEVKSMFSKSIGGVSIAVVLHHMKSLYAEQPEASDSVIVLHLKEKGIDIARRTVAKYRAMLA